MNRPKLNDKIYGQMFWEEWDEDEAYWYAPMKDAAGKQFSLLIRAASPLDFPAVGQTHSTYEKLLRDINSTLDKTVIEVLENSRELFKKKRQRNTAGEAIKKNLRLFSIKIFQDLSAEVEFSGAADDEDTDEVFYALIDAKGDFVEAGITEL